MANKSVLIYIPGTEVPKNNNIATLVVKFINFFLNKLFRFESTDSDINKTWYNFLENHFQKLLILEWKMIPTYRALSQASHDLEKIINENCEKNVYIFAGSLGAEIALRCKEFHKVKRALFICPVNKNRRVDNTEIYEIYSSKDNYARTAKRLFWPFSNSAKLSGSKVTNINVKPFRHKDFSPNTVGNIIINMLKINKGSNNERRI